MNDIAVMNPTQVVYQEWQTAWEFFNKHLFKGELPPCLITLHRHPRARGYFSADRFISTNGESTSEIAMNPEYFAMQSAKSVLSTLVHEMVHGWQHYFGTDKSRKTYHNVEWAEKMSSLGLEPSSTGMPGGSRVGQKVTHYIVQGGPFDTLCDELLAKGNFVSWFDRHTAVDDENSHYVHTGDNPDAPDQTPLAQSIGEGTEALPAPSDQSMSAGEEGGSGAEPTAPLAPAEKKKQPVIPQTQKPIAAKMSTQLSTPAARKAAAGTDKSNRSKFVCPECGDAAWGKPTLKIMCVNCMKDMVAR